MIASGRRAGIATTTACLGFFFRGFLLGNLISSISSTTTSPSVAPAVSNFIALPVNLRHKENRLRQGESISYTAAASREAVAIRFAHALVFLNAASSFTRLAVSELAVRT